MAGTRARRWGIGFAVFTAVGTLNFFYHFLDDRARGLSGTAGTRALEEYTGAYAAALLFVAVVWLVRRWPLRRARWRKPLAVYAAALPLYGAVFTTLMLESRDLLSPLLGLGAYNYGDLWWRYPMEFSNQVVSFAVMVGGVWAYDVFRENRARELRTAQLEQKLARAQLEHLRLQLQPHFLFNTLNTISSVMYEDVDRADAMLARLSELLRHTLAAGAGAEAQRGEVELRHELETSRLYLDLMRARMEDGLQVAYDVAPEAEAALVPHFLLQPLVENALRHGGGTVTLRAARAGGALELEVRDSGRQRLAAAAPAAGAGHGIGLANTGQRLQQMYAGTQRFAYGPEPGGGFAVRLRVPFRT